MISRRSVLGMIGAAPLAAAQIHGGQGGSTLDARIRSIINRPEFRGARWGMKFAWPETNEAIYSIVPDQPFTAGSAAKVFTEGTVFSTLGPEYRFRTKACRTGPVVDGVLKGDLVLVAGGDLLIGGRIRPDGTLTVPSPDHTYGSEPPIPGDPLRVLRELAWRVAARGVRRIAGRIVMDASLFREDRREIGTGGGPVAISPMLVNDNVVDVTVLPGREVGAPGVLRPSPRTEYVEIRNEVRTVAAVDAPAAAKLAFTDDAANPDGTRTVRLTGEVPMGEIRYRAYFVPEPVRFAEQLFTEALRDTGVVTEAGPRIAAEAGSGQARDPLAEHVSPPLSEAVKVMLKASSNLHTVTFPYLVGAIVGGESENPTAVYEAYRRRLFEHAGVDPDVSDYSADFFTTFLAHQKRQPYFREYRDALPIMGRDGTLEQVQPNSPAAGHVYAKTGSGRATPNNPMASKALAGYIELPNGQTVTFAEFMELDANVVPVETDEAMGEIVTAVYETFR
jgi:D-alanyl-D-alanine carboxypeptidase/D-alanyl-D-alanine-endopeptidase (penicillin-binding protein 4)